MGAAPWPMSQMHMRVGVTMVVVVVVISAWLWVDGWDSQWEPQQKLILPLDTLLHRQKLNDSGLEALQLLGHIGSILTPLSRSDLGTRVPEIQGFLVRLIQIMESSFQPDAVLDPVNPVLNQDGVMRIAAFFMSMVLARTPPTRNSSTPKPPNKLDCFLCPPEGTAIARKQRGYIVAQSPFHHAKSKVVAIMIAGNSRSFFGILAFWRIFIENIRQTGREPVLFVVAGRQTCNTFLDRAARPGQSEIPREVKEESIQDVFRTLSVEGHVRLVDGNGFRFDAYRDLVEEPLLKAVLESQQSETQSGSNAGAMKRTVAFDMILKWEREHQMGTEQVISMRPDVILNAAFVTNVTVLTEMFEASSETSLVFNDCFGFIPRAHIGVYSSFPAMYRSLVQADTTGSPLYRQLFTALVAPSVGAGSLAQPTTLLSYMEIPFRGIGIESQWTSGGAPASVSMMNPDPLLPPIPGCADSLVQFILFIREAMIDGKYYPCIDEPVESFWENLVQAHGPIYTNGVFNPSWKCFILPGILDTAPIPVCPSNSKDRNYWRTNWTMK